MPEVDPGEGTMHEIKTVSAKPSFWCGILTAEKQATAPTQARTVRGPYTTFNLANSQRDKTGGIAFRIAGRGAELAMPTGSLRLTIVLGDDRAAGLEGACATRSFAAAACHAKRFGFRCA